MGWKSGKLVMEVKRCNSDHLIGIGRLVASLKKYNDHRYLTIYGFKSINEDDEQCQSTLLRRKVFSL